MIPVRLELKNFLPYRAPDALRFEGIHLACLTGANGAGKSSLLDAITWALWGRARAKRDDDLIHMGQNDMYVQLDFEQEGIIYRVLRKRSRGRRGAGSLDLFVLDQDQPRLINEPALRATQDKINRILRLDYETFVHSAFLQQGKADAFTTINPAERKRILSDILGLEQWAQYEDQVKEHLKELTAELNVIDVRIEEIARELAREPQLRADVNSAEATHAEATEALRLAEEALAEVAHAPGELRHTQEQLAGIARRCSEHERDLDTVTAEIERHEARIATYQEVIATRDEIEDGYATLQSAREADSSLSEKLSLLSDVDKQVHELERQLDAARAELESERSGYTASIAELERAIEMSDGDDLAEVHSEVSALQDLQAQRDSMREEVGVLGEERAGLEAENTSLRAEMENIKDQLDRIQQVEDAMCPLCGQELDEDHRRELIAQLEQKGKQRGDAYRANHARLQEIASAFSDTNTHIQELDLDLKRLEPLNRRLGELQAQVDSANEAAVRLDKARAERDAVEKMLADESFGLDIREQLTTLDAQRVELGYDRDSHDEAREQLATYREYEARQMHLQSALDSLPEAEDMLENAGKRRERISKAIEDDQAEIEGLQGEIAELEVLVREQQIRQQEVNTQRTSERQIYQRLVNARQELSALENQRARKTELENRREEKRHEEGIYTELRQAFGKNGIPAMMIESAIPELESAANGLLARMTDGRMALRLTTQREKVTGGITETLDIEIADELGTRTYEMYSGGEAFRIDFAIRVALSQMLARRAGAHLRTLFIDEGFGTQDDDGRGKLVEAITAIQDSFDLILVITHLDDLRDSFPVHIMMEKTPNGSRISVR